MFFNLFILIYIFYLFVVWFGLVWFGLVWFKYNQFDLKISRLKKVLI